jgi:hypothetical protein
MRRYLPALLLTLTACAHTPPPVQLPPVQLPPVVQRVNVYPVIPATDLMCAAVPPPAVGISDDVALAQYVQTTLDAWYDCFTKVKTLNGIVGAWPR